MAHSVPTSEPEKIRAGDTVTWLKDLSDYTPDDGWVLYYALLNAAGQVLIIATDNGDGRHLVEEAASDTEAWTPGDYKIHGYAENSSSGDRHTVYEQYIKIEPGLHLSAYSAGRETRSTNKQTLDALEAMIQGKASKDQQNYAIAGRSLSSYSPGELIEWRREYRRLWNEELAALRKAAGKSPRRHIKIRPGRA